MKKKRILISIFILVIFVAGGAGFYINDYYRASDEAAATFASGEGLTDRVTVFRPAEAGRQPEPIAGLIFYPGGKVEVSAYAPLMEELAKEGVLCALVEMPANLAVLDSDAADGIRERFPEVERWYIGGHSLGGAMAASYAADHGGELEGAILLAAYSTKDLSDSGLDVVSIYGSEDQVLDREKYEEYRRNLPIDTIEFIIRGGNHAQFGDYGPQDGDGEAMISGEEQIAIVVTAIEEFINK